MTPTRQPDPHNPSARRALGSPGLPKLTCEVRPLDGGADSEAFAAELADSIAAYLRDTGRDHAVSAPGRGVITIEVFARDDVLPGLAGIHRVQRMPASGRGKRHSSTVSLSVISQNQSRPRARITAESLDSRDLEISWYRGTGPGGQHRNTTLQAVRLRHLPSGILISVDGRSRTQNLAEARTLLAERLNALESSALAAKAHSERTSQTGLPTDGGKDFTWNFQRSEVLDHRQGRVWRLRDAQRGRWDRQKR